MATEKVRLCDIKPNPFRNMERYPIDAAKIVELKESIETTGFWDNVVCRRNGDGEIEQAYGHHRLIAARDVMGGRATIEVPIKDLDDTAMLKIMVRENSDTWTNSVQVNQETVRATVQAYADGRITLGVVGKDTSKNKIRHAPSFLQGDGLPPGEDRPYTAETLSEFLGWNVRKAQKVLEELEHVERGTVPEKVFKDLSLKEAEQTSREASKTYRAVKAEAAAAGEDEHKAEQRAKTAAKAVASEVAAKLKRGEVSTAKAAEAGASARERYVKAKRKEERGLPGINEKAREVREYIDGVLGPGAFGDELKEIIKNKEYMTDAARGLLERSLGRLAERVEKFMGDISSGRALVRR